MSHEIPEVSNAPKWLVYFLKCKNKHDRLTVHDMIGVLHTSTMPEFTVVNNK